jgi:molybdopterin synthase catalytic subunit
MIRVAVQCGPFAADAETAKLQALGGGAIATFTGIVRNDGGIDELFLEHYPAMTERALVVLAEAAVARWALLGAVVVHRVGALKPGDPIVFVATASPHRAAALEACAFLIDRLKTDAPFWKRERRGGADLWVEARGTDDQAAARWG